MSAELVPRSPRIISPVRRDRYVNRLFALLQPGPSILTCLRPEEAPKVEFGATSRKVVAINALFDAVDSASPAQHEAAYRELQEVTEAYEDARGPYRLLIVGEDPVEAFQCVVRVFGPYLVCLPEADRYFIESAQLRLEVSEVGEIIWECSRGFWWPYVTM